MQTSSETHDLQYVLDRKFIWLMTRKHAAHMKSPIRKPRLAINLKISKTVAAIPSSKDWSNWTQQACQRNNPSLQKPRWRNQASGQPPRNIQRWGKALLINLCGSLQLMRRLLDKSSTERTQEQACAQTPNGYRYRDSWRCEQHCKTALTCWSNQSTKSSVGWIEHPNADYDKGRRYGVDGT